jgi:hypothetical protein
MTFNQKIIKSMLADYPPSLLSMPSLEYGLNLAASSKSDYFTLKTPQQLNFLQHFSIDTTLFVLFIIYFLT